MSHIKYLALTKSAEINALITHAHSEGSRVELIVIKSIQDSEGNLQVDQTCTLPDHVFQDNGARINFSANAIGNYSIQDGYIWVQTAFNGKKGEYFIPVGSVYGVLIDGDIVWQASALFILGTTETTPASLQEDAEKAVEAQKIDAEIADAGDNVVSLFGGSNNVH